MEKKITTVQKYIFIIFVFCLCLVPVIMHFTKGGNEGGSGGAIDFSRIEELPPPQETLANSADQQPCRYCTAPIEELLVMDTLLAAIPPDITPDKIPDVQMQYDPVWGGFFVSPEDRRKSLIKTAWEIYSFVQLEKKNSSGQFAPLVEKNIDYIMNFLAQPGNSYFVGQHGTMMNQGQVLEGKDYYDLPESKRLKTGLPARIKTSAPESALMTAFAFANAADLLQDPALLKRAEDTPLALENFSGSNDSFTMLAKTCLALELYQATGDNKWLKLATNTAREMLEKEVLANPIRNKLLSDEVMTQCECTPEYRAAAALVLSQLYHITDIKEFQDAADAYLAGNPVTEQVKKLVTAHPLKAAIVGPADDPRTDELRRQVRLFFEPNKVIMTLDPKRDAQRLSELPYQERPEPTVFACVENACSMPVSDPEKVRPHLRKFVDRYLYKKTGLNKLKLD